MRSQILPLLTASLACLSATSQAQIGVNTTNTFSSLPPTTEWTTLSVPGASGTPTDATTLDSFVQTNVASTVTLSLFPTNIAAPIQLGISQWTSFGTGYLVTRPTGNSYQILMATIRNTTANNLPFLGIVFDQALPSPLANEDPGLAGLRAYYSFTGDVNTWTFVPELQSSVAGQRSAVLNLGTWNANDLLYLIFVDDNGNGATDGSFAIDNFGVVGTIGGPVITNQPKSANVVVAQIIRLSVGASGLGLSYQWFKDGTPIDGVANPTATQATLVITNAQSSDSGSYRVTVNNPAGGAVSDSVTVNVGIDNIPPRMVRFSPVPGSTNFFRLAVTEPLCEGAPFGTCTFGDATFTFNWEFGEVGGAGTLVTAIAPENGTNYIFTFTDEFIDPAKQYFLMPQPDSVTDRFNTF